MELSSSRWTELADRPLVLVPVGSTEQHGPHLPFDTDAVIATEVARAVAERLGPTVVVAPPLNYGSSGEHQDFPGTISIGQDALRMVLIELTRSLATWAGDVVFVNGHGGNAPVLAGAVTQLIAEGHRVAWTPCAAPGSDAHAGLTETSLMLRLRPSAVKLSAAEAGNVEPIAALLPQLRRDGVRAVSANGVLGDPSGASAEQGAALLAQLVDQVCADLLAGSVDRTGRLRMAEASRP